MPDQAEVIRWLDAQFESVRVEDSPRAMNGLQVEGANRASRKIAAAVDACEATLRAAVEASADVLIVHHGLFWQGVQPVTGALRRKLELLISSGLALYSMHLPLDAHPQLGNNVLLCKALGFGEGAPWFDLGGTPVGRAAVVDIALDELTSRIARALGATPHLCPGGPRQVRRLGIVTGAAGAEVAAAAAQGVDTFLTGEAPHWAYTLAEELGVNLLLGGHYATETLGVKALAKAVAERFGIEWIFLDHPTGL